MSRALQRRPRGRARAAGFTYLAVLLLVALMGIALAATGEVWHTVAQRAKERRLLYVGDRYRRAIGLYYVNGPAQYPRKLQDLLRDPRKQDIERYLRKLYPDPLTARNDWETVKGPDGGIMGVYSPSAGTPIKRAGFDSQDQGFEQAATYRDWKFVYVPPQQRQNPVQQ